MAETLAVSEMVIFRFFCRISPIKLRPRTRRGHYSRSKVVANLNVITSTALNLQIGDFLEFLIETASFLASLLFCAAALIITAQVFLLGKCVALRGIVFVAFTFNGREIRYSPL